MSKNFKFLSLLLTLLVMPLYLSSCNNDDDEPNDSAYYDFSIIWDVVDKGVYTTAEAMTLVADLTNVSENLFTACTTARAINEFNEFCEQMRYELATDCDEITIKAKLVRNEGNKTVATKTFYIKPDGTILKLPANYGMNKSTIEE